MFSPRISLTAKGGGVGMIADAAIDPETATAATKVIRAMPVL